MVCRWLVVRLASPGTRERRDLPDDCLLAHLAGDLIDRPSDVWLRGPAVQRIVVSRTQMPQHRV
jgi:hypothetical protein